MTTRSSITGSVRAIRETTHGVQAEVVVGGTSKGWVTLKITGNSPEVKEAMAALRTALRTEAHDLLLAAQEDTEARGMKAVGR